MLSSGVGVWLAVGWAVLSHNMWVVARLAQAEILVLPNTGTRISARYTSPLKLFEYLAAGRPIVASDLAASEAAHPDLVRRHEVLPVEVAQSAFAVATDMASEDEPGLSDAAPAAEEEERPAGGEPEARPSRRADGE